MKNLYIIIAVITIFSFTSANAQGVKFGVKAGVNFASIIGDGTENIDMRTSYHVGAVVEIGISERFSFQPELLYSVQGAKEKVSEVELTYKFDYINLPLIAKYYLAEGFSLEAGPYVGLLMSAKVEAEGPGGSFDEDVKDSFNDIDFGANTGVAYKLENGLSFGARYNFGLFNIVDVVGDNSKIYNRVIQVSVGYFF
ncbi:MAG: PorT family protein [Flavobacteriaceae bacterium]|nr:PorT family protein [Flavobacteriaceae bacterium]